MTANRSVTDIAAAVGTSPFHLCRIFRAHTGRTMHEYRTELRLRMALEHLASSAGMNLSQVAHELGFASHAHFVRVCQAHFGMPPGALRKRLAAFA
jgi:AraC-like DNA-binding protein